MIPLETDDQNILKFNSSHLTKDINKALEFADYIFICNSPGIYQSFDKITFKSILGIMDACNIYNHQQFVNKPIKYSGIGRGTGEPTAIL
jgi:hypothetical protein